MNNKYPVSWSAHADKVSFYGPSAERQRQWERYGRSAWGFGVATDILRLERAVEDLTRRVNTDRLPPPVPPAAVDVELRQNLRVCRDTCELLRMKLKETEGALNKARERMRILEAVVVSGKFAALTEKEREALTGAMNSEHARGAWQWADTIKNLMSRLT